MCCISRLYSFTRHPCAAVGTSRGLRKKITFAESSRKYRNPEPWACKICISWQHRNSEPWTMNLQNMYVLTKKLWTPKNPKPDSRLKILHFIAIPSNLLIHALRDKYNRRSNHPKARFSPLRLVANEKQPLLLIKEHHKWKWSYIIISLSKYKNCRNCKSLTAALWHSSRSFQSCYLLLPPSTTVHSTTASCYFLVHPLIPLRPTQSDSELNQLVSNWAWI